VSIKNDLPISTTTRDLASLAWDTLTDSYSQCERRDLLDIGYVGEDLEDTLILYLLNKYPLLCTAILNHEPYDASTLPDNLYADWDGHGNPPDAEFVLVPRAYFTKQDKQK